jgi:hypothetical protein
MKALGLAMVAAAVLGLGSPGRAQTVVPGYSEVRRTGEGIPPRHGSGVVLVFDPYEIPSPDAYVNRQAEGAYESRPVFLDESDARLPDAQTLHRQIQFGKPRKRMDSDTLNLNTEMDINR